MVRNRRARRPRGRQGRLTGRLGAVLVILALVAWFAFTQVFFDPFEKSQPGFDRLVPRDVEVFLRREQPASDFSAFPQPRLLDRLALRPEWRALVATEWWAGLEWPQTLAAGSEQLREALAELPVDVLEFMGEEVVLVARNATEGGPWALLGRLSKAGKLAVQGALLGRVLPGRVEHVHPTLRDVRYHEAPVDGAPLFFARDLDLLVVSRDAALVRDVLATARGGAEQSLGLSRLVDESLPRARFAPDEGFDLSFTADLGRLLPLLRSQDAAQKGPSRDALSDALPRLVNLDPLRAAAGRLEIQGGRLALRLHADVDAALAAADRGGLVGRPAFTARRRLRETLLLLPEDTAAALTLNVDLRRAAGVFLDALRPELRMLIDGTLRDISRLGTDKILDAPSLVQRLSRVVEDEFTFALRPSYHAVPEGHQPLPSLAIVLRLRDAAGWGQIEQFMLLGHELLGMSSKNMFYVNEGVGMRKYAEFSGRAFREIAWMVLDDKYLVFANDNDLLAHMVEVYTLNRPSLATSRAAGSERLHALLAGLEPPGQPPAQGNAAAWVDAARLLALLAPYGEYLADLDTHLDFAGLREEKRSELLRTRSSGRDAFGAAEAAALERELDELLAAEEQRRRSETVPRLARAWQERLQWLTLVRQGVFVLRLGERSAGLHLEVSTVLDP